MRPTGLIIIIREPLYYFFVLVGLGLNILKVYTFFCTLLTQLQKKSGFRSLFLKQSYIVLIISYLVLLMAKWPFLQLICEHMQVQCYSQSTIQTYVYWIRGYIRFNGLMA